MTESRRPGHTYQSPLSRQNRGGSRRYVPQRRVGLDGWLSGENTHTQKKKFFLLLIEEGLRHLDLTHFMTHHILLLSSWDLYENFLLLLLSLRLPLPFPPKIRCRRSYYQLPITCLNNILVVQVYGYRALVRLL